MWTAIVWSWTAWRRVADLSFAGGLHCLERRDRFDRDRNRSGPRALLSGEPGRRHRGEVQGRTRGVHGAGACTVRDNHRITTRTTGPVPVTDSGDPFRVLLGPVIEPGWWNADPGHVDPNGTLETMVRPRIGEYSLGLSPVPETCLVQGVPASFPLVHGIDVIVEFVVECREDGPARSR